MDENKGLVETMEDYAEELEASFKRLHEGDIVTGTVVAVTDDQAGGSEIFCSGRD